MSDHSARRTDKQNGKVKTISRVTDARCEKSYKPIAVSSCQADKAQDEKKMCKLHILCVVW